MPITPPIFVSSDDLLAFPSVKAAESYLEPVDVEPTDKGYDAEGRLLRVEVRGHVRRDGGVIDQSRARVELTLTEDAPGHADELRAALRIWLGKAEPAADLDSADLGTLVARASHRSGRVAKADARRARRILTICGVVLLAAAVWWLAFR